MYRTLSEQADMCLDAAADIVRETYGYSDPDETIDICASFDFYL